MRLSGIVVRLEALCGDRQLLHLTCLERELEQ